jgi:hypothetical protein
MTLGMMRQLGVATIWAWCLNPDCRFAREVEVDHLRDETDVHSIGNDLQCPRCGHVGQGVIPNWDER